MSSSLFHVKEHTTAGAHIREYARATSHSQDEVLLLHVKQYIPKDNPEPQKGDVTIIGAHANGFPKELYEPLWDDFYQEAKKQNIRIRSIWIADAAWQGQSGLLNADKLGNDPSWLDYSRDILQIINTFRMPPPLVGIGHSFGGTALTNVALLHPRLLSSLVLLDPVISRFASTPGVLSSGPAAMSIYRRDVWPSRAEAAASFKKSPFYQSWDPRALNLWLEYGLRRKNVEGAGEDGEVTLTTTKHQEVFTYLRPSWPAYDAQGKTLLHRDLVPDLNDSFGGSNLTYPIYRPETVNTLVRLPNLRPGVLYVFGGKSDLSSPELRREKLELTGTGVGGSGGAKLGRVKEVLAEENGHLVPLEAPQLCAHAAADWLRTALDSWLKQEKEFEEWTRTPAADKVTIPEDFKAYVGKPNRRGQNKAKI